MIKIPLDDELAKSVLDYLLKLKEDKQKEIDELKLRIQQLKASIDAEQNNQRG